MIEVRLASTRGSALPALILACVLGVASPPLDAQEPVAWGDELVFHTFSIVAVDPATGESGVTVTTRVPCVGNGVPWVRAGVGAVATPDTVEFWTTGQFSHRAAAGLKFIEIFIKKIIEKY